MRNHSTFVKGLGAWRAMLWCTALSVVAWAYAAEPLSPGQMAAIRGGEYCGPCQAWTPTYYECGTYTVDATMACGNSTNWTGNVPTAGHQMCIKNMVFIAQCPAAAAPGSSCKVVSSGGAWLMQLWTVNSTCAAPAGNQGHYEVGEVYRPTVATCNCTGKQGSLSIACEIASCGPESGAWESGPFAKGIGWKCP